MTQDSPEPVQNREIDYGKIISTFLSRWYWIAACVVVAAVTATLYLLLVHPKYTSTTSLMLTEPKSDVARILSEDGATNTAETFNLTQSATFIITSEAFLNNAVAKLNYKYSFFYKSRFSTEELYPEKPFLIDILQQDSTNYYHDLFTIIDRGDKFSLGVGEDPENGFKDYPYGVVVEAPGLRFKVRKSTAARDFTYYFRFHTKESVMKRVANNLSLEPQNLSILALSHTDFTPGFSADLLNAITSEYVIYEARSRNKLASQRMTFIERQLDTLGRRANEISGILDSIKRMNGVANNLPVKMQADIARVAQYEGQRSVLDIERISINQLEEQATRTGARLELNYGLEGEMGNQLSDLISQYNTQISEREQTREKYVATSEPVKTIDKKLSDIRLAIYNSIRQMRERNDQRRQYYDKLILTARAEMDNIPAEAKDYIKLQTEFEINRKIFSNFTEERFKSQIELAAMAPTASVIYEAVPSGTPVSPQKQRIRMFALVFGGGIGVGLILLARLLNRKLRDVGSVLLKTPVPVLGLIRKATKKELGSTVAFHEYPTTLFAESIRNFRANLLGVLAKTNGKVIAVGSERSGEGRSFVVMNLAASLAQLDKRVIVVDADLRKPSPEKYSYAEELGLSAYLINFKPMLGTIRHTDIPNLDVVPSGVAPSNPSELLHSQKMKELLSYLRNIYDYVLIDTSPAGVFADAIPVFDKADINLFVLRGGFSGMNALPSLNKIIADYRFQNFYVLLNSFQNDKLYQPFVQGVNADIYFNTGFGSYNKKYSHDSDMEKWEEINRKAR